MKVKVDIISGFLGAGKTMLIKKLIEEKLYKDKIVIIENEFGEVGIDGAILKRSNLAVKEINAGCICCTVNGNFKAAVKEAINQYSPSRIIIEPSGVGKLSEIIDLCKSQELKNLIQINMKITVVDVLKYNIYIQNFNEFYKDQILNASTVVLSRTQKVKSDKLDKLTKDISDINNGAVIVTTPWNSLSGIRIAEIAENSKEQSFKEQLKKFKISSVNSNIKLKKTSSLVNRHNADEIFQTWGIETSKVFSKNRLKDIFNNAEKENMFGYILRAKGIVQVEEAKWIQFDYVPGELQIKNTTADYSGKLCVIGNNLNKNMLYKILIE